LSVKPSVTGRLDLGPYAPEEIVKQRNVGRRRSHQTL